MKKHLVPLAITLAALSVAGSAHAGLAGIAIYSNGTVSSSSMSLGDSLLVENVDGGFNGLVNPGSGGTADPVVITGLSSAPKLINIADWFSFSSTTSLALGNGDRFQFDLTSLTETSPFNSSLNIASFSGTGTIVDTDGVYKDAPATFSLSFSGQGSDSFSLSTTLTPVPEPTTIIAGAAMLLPFGVGAFRQLRKGQKA